MNVTTEKIDDLNAVLKVELKPEDYQEKVDKILKDYTKNANVPGFRKGHVPMGMIKKQYGTAVLVDEINHKLQHAVNDYINENKLNILGNPLPSPQDNIDWETQKEFTFEFELGLAPEFDIAITDKDKLTHYKINADKKMIDRYATDIAKRYGKVSNPDTTQEDDMLYFDYKELDKNGVEVADGIFNSATFSTEKVKDKKIKKQLVGLKKDDTLIFNPTGVFESDYDTAQSLGTEVAKLPDYNKDFKFTLTTIQRVEPAEINQELFDKVYGEGNVKNEEEFRGKIKEEAERMFVGESDRKLENDAIEYLMGKVKIDLPNEFLKKWMLSNGENQLTAEQIESEYDQYAKSLKWQLIESKLLRDNNVVVSQEEIKEHTKSLIKGQMAQYGQLDTTDEQLENIATGVMQNQEEVQKIHEQLYNIKLLELFKDKFKLKEKELTFDEFLKLVSK